MAQLPKGTLVKGPYKRICRDCVGEFFGDSLKQTDPPDNQGHDNLFTVGWPQCEKNYTPRSLTAKAPENRWEWKTILSFNGFWYHFRGELLNYVVKNLWFSPLFGEDFQFDDHIFQMGWFNHQPVNFGKGNAEFGTAFCKNIGLELGSIEVFIYSWPTIVLDRWQPEIPRPTTSWMYKIPANDGMNYQPQLVQDFFHQHYFVF